MAVKTKIEPIDRDVQLIIARDLSPKARSVALATYAREALEEGQEANARVLGRVPLHETFVDGRRTDALESVRPEGTIQFEFNLLEDIFGWIAEQLVVHSPIGSVGDHHPGLYRRSFAFFADGKRIAPGIGAPAAAEYVFINTQPYSRKIERGLSPQAPDGVFHAIAEMAARRFGNMAVVRFGYRAPVAGGLMGGKRGNRSDRRTPAIIITMRGR